MSEAGSDPLAHRHQQQSLLLAGAFTQRKEPTLGGSPVLFANGHLPNEIRFRDGQEAVGTLASHQDSFQEQLVVTHPDAWLRALEYAPDHSQRVVGIEAADRIESRIATNLWPLAHFVTHNNAGRIVVNGPRKATTGLVFSEPDQRLERAVPRHVARSVNE